MAFNELYLTVFDVEALGMLGGCVSAFFLDGADVICLISFMFHVME